MRAGWFLLFVGELAFHSLAHLTYNILFRFVGLILFATIKMLFFSIY